MGDLDFYISRSLPNSILAETYGVNQLLYDKICDGAVEHSIDMICISVQ